MNSATKTRIEEMYKTAQVVAAMPGIKAGEFVSIVRFHDYNGTYTIRSIDGVLQAMVSPACLTRFCL